MDEIQNVYYSATKTEVVSKQKESFKASRSLVLVCASGTICLFKLNDIFAAVVNESAFLKLQALVFS